MNAYNLGLVAGMLVVLIVFVVLVLIFKNAGGLSGFSEKNYDERQQRARGIAFKSGFFTLMVYNFLYGISAMLVDRPWCDVFTGCFIGICVSVTVFAVVSIMKDAYMSLKDKPKKIVILFVFIAVINLVAAVARTLTGDKLMENGALTYACTNYLVVAMFVIIFIAMGIKGYLDKKELAE